MSNVRLGELDFDPLVVKPRVTKHFDALGAVSSVVVDLPHQDISNAAETKVKDFITEWLTKSRLIRWGERYLGIEQIITRILAYNTPGTEFRC